MKICHYEFKDQLINLDLNEFENCSFENCRMVVQGLGGFKLTDCTRTNCKFEFAGPAATTLQLMSTLYQQGGKDLVEAAFDNIRRGPQATPS